MNTNGQFSIPTPCTENWENMTPENQGRFCGSCRKTVVDFTQMTDRQLQQWFSLHQGSVCGRFHQEQLDRPVVLPVEKKPGGWRYWQYLLSALLVTSEVTAQTIPDRPEVSQQLPAGEGAYLSDLVSVGKVAFNRKPPKEQPGILRGRLLDMDGHPVPYASITFGNKRGVQADSNGYYRFSRAGLSDTAMLTFSALGFETQRLRINQLWRDKWDKTVPLVLESAREIMGEFIIIADKHPKKKSIADTLSRIKDSLSCLKPAKNQFTVYPNPVSRGNAVHISAKLNQPGNYQVQLFNTAGTLLETLSLSREQMSGTTVLNIPAGLVPGTYLIRLSHPELKRPMAQQILVY